MNYSNTAVETTLQSGLTADTTTVLVNSATGYPDAPFAIVVNDAEVMLVTAKAGTIWTVTRGYDDTTATTHASGATVYHAMIAADLVDRVSGTGTAGRAAFWSDTDTLSSYATSLYWDAVNSRLGIGIDPPLAPLHVNLFALSGASSGSSFVMGTGYTTPLTGTANVHAITAEYDPATAHAGTRVWAALRSVAQVRGTTPGLTLPLTMRGLNAVVQNIGDSILSGTTTGQYAQVINLAAGTIANANAVRGEITNSGSGIITLATTLRANRPIGGSGSYGDIYGLYIENQTPASGTVTGTANGIYQEGTANTNTYKGPSVFDGKLTANGGTAGIPRTLTLGYISGGAVVANDVGMNINLDVNMTLQSVRLYAKTPPVGSVLTVDIKRSTDSGATYTTIFSGLPTIAAAANVGGSAAVFSVTSVSAGDIFRVDVTTVGSGTAGSNITVQLNGVTR